MIARMRYNPPSNWPQAPDGWTPPPGWQPDPSWGPAPVGWKVWIDNRSWFARHKALTIVGALVVLGAAGAAVAPADGAKPTAAVVTATATASVVPTTTSPVATTAEATSATPAPTEPAPATTTEPTPKPTLKPQPWYPNGYVSVNETTAAKWIPASQTHCDFDTSCWQMYIVTKDGCRSGVYVEIALLDKSGTNVGMSNDVTGHLAPGQKAKLTFDSFQNDATRAQLSQVQCEDF